MSTLYLIRGLPGAGKSKFAHSIHNNLPKSVVIEADQYFLDEDGYYIFESSNYIEHTNDVKMILLFT